MATSATAVPMGRSSSRRALIIALVFGAIAAFLVFYFLTRAGGGATATTPVVIAARDIPLGTQIAATDLKLQDLPKAGVHPLALLDKPGMQGAIGQIATEPLTNGQQVLTTELTKNPNDLSLSAEVPSGMRAMSINVSGVAGNAGFIKPGDLVDVIGTFPTNVPLPSNTVTVGGNHVVSVTIAQNVKVLAFGAVAQAPQQAGAAGAGLQPTQGSTVTFLLTPDQAEKMFLAEGQGQLRLALRPLNETQATQVQPIDNTLQGIVSAPGQ